MKKLNRLLTLTKHHIPLPPQRVGVVSTLHCKKLRLAVEAATSAEASPLQTIDHRWVAGETRPLSQWAQRDL